MNSMLIRYSLIPMIVLSVASTVLPASGDDHPLIEQRDRLEGLNRYFANRDLLVNSLLERYDDIIYTLDDITELSKRVNRDEDLVDVFDGVIQDPSVAEEVRDRALLNRARVIARSLDQEQGYLLLEDYIRERKGEALLIYSYALLDNQDVAGTALLCYDRNPDYQHFRSGRDDLAIFTTLLLQMKQRNLTRIKIENSLFIPPNSPVLIVNRHDSAISAEESIANRLSDRTGWDEWREAAHALCIAMDGKFEEAEQVLLNLLDGVEPSLVEDGAVSVNLYADIPFYLAYVSALNEDADEQTVLDYLDMYVERNANDIDFAFDRMMRFARDVLEFNGGRHLLPVMQHIREHFIDQEEIANQLPVDDVPGIAHFYDIYASGLMSAGDIDGAIELYETLVDRYFPRNLASVNAAFSLANLYVVYKRDEEKGRMYAQRIIQESDEGNIIQNAQRFLGNIDRLMSMPPPPLPKQ